MRLWSARSQLGINLMRLGQEDERGDLGCAQQQLSRLRGHGLRLLGSYQNPMVSVRQNNTTNLNSTRRKPISSSPTSSAS
jgi:hypothetical protein